MKKRDIAYQNSDRPFCIGMVARRTVAIQSMFVIMFSHSGLALAAAVHVARLVFDAQQGARHHCSCSLYLL